MSTHPRTAAARQRTSAPPSAAAAPMPSRETLAARRKTAAEITALLRLAELDAAALRRAQNRPAALEGTADERRSLAGRISGEILDAYHRAMRGGRQPAVTRLVGSVCYGCFVRLHAKLDHHLRHHRGIGSCPHCLRVVYDPAWLEDSSKEALER